MIEGEMAAQRKGKFRRASVTIAGILAVSAGSFATSFGTAAGFEKISERVREAEVLSSPKLKASDKARLKKLPKRWMEYIGEHHGLYAESPGKEPEIRNFEKLGVSSELVADLVRQTFPRSWATHNVDTIEFKEETLALPKSYNLQGRDTLAECAPPQGGKRQRISFSILAKSYSADYILNETLAHELAHAHDFRYARLSPAERLAFLSKILERLESEGRFRSSYVEDINNKDKAAELEGKALEYWAEIFGTYLSDPFEAKTKLPKEDLEIIKEYFNLVAPGFNFEAAWSRRQKIISQFGRLEMLGKIPEILEGAIQEDRMQEMISFMTAPPPSADKESLKRRTDLTDRIEAKLSEMPKSWVALYNGWREGRRLINLARAQYNSNAPHAALEDVRKVKSNCEGFTGILQKLDAKERERAEEFFEELDALLNVDFSNEAPLVELPPDPWRPSK